MLSSAKAIIDDIRQGKMVILMDDEDRENEGDILVAADKVTPEIINFMATHGRGLICLTLTQTRCQQLNLPLMVQNNTESFGTNFTVSIEAAHGVGTGISAKDRCCTIQAAVALDATPASVVTPGHVFPIMAREGGVLVRAGHTEAGCDVARLAGLTPACAIVEILNEDGSMARRPELELFSTKHGIKLGTIADLIEYRYANEKTIERVSEMPITTQYGEFTLITYRDLITGQIHFALTNGTRTADEATLVRVHVRDILNDIFYMDHKTWSIANAMQKIAQEGGVLLILSDQEMEQAVLNNILDGHIATNHTTHPHRSPSNKIGSGSQILADLGVRKIRLLTSTNQRYHALSGFGLEVVEYICE